MQNLQIRGNASSEERGAAGLEPYNIHNDSTM